MCYYTHIGKEGGRVYGILLIKEADLTEAVSVGEQSSGHKYFRRELWWTFPAYTTNIYTQCKGNLYFPDVIVVSKAYCLSLLT